MFKLTLPEHLPSPCLGHFAAALSESRVKHGSERICNFKAPFPISTLVTGSHGQELSSLSVSYMGCWNRQRTLYSGQWIQGPWAEPSGVSTSRDFQMGNKHRDKAVHRSIQHPVTSQRQSQDSNLSVPSSRDWFPDLGWAGKWPE